MKEINPLFLVGTQDIVVVSTRSVEVVAGVLFFPSSSLCVKVLTLLAIPFSTHNIPTKISIFSK